jgi:AcrR family transcriptional regulator
VTAARRRTGRRPGSADTRGRILDAARHAFGERGFEQTSIRQVAADAGVDPALVHHYFGSKQRLFISAMDFPVDPAAVIPALIAGGPRDRVGERFAAFVIGLWDRPDVRPLVTGVVRSAATDPVAAGMARRLLTEGPLLALASAIDRPDAALRATLAGAQLMGVVMARYVVQVEPVASMAPDALAALIGPSIQHFLAGDLGATVESRRG